MVSNLPTILDMARNVQATLPKGGEDPRPWMLQASDFCEICLVAGRLTPEIESKVPLQDRGNIIRAINTIKETGGQFNSGLLAAT